MRATVRLLNRGRGFVGVETERGDYSVLELMGGGDMDLVLQR
jgi:hypothetical protein